MISKIFLIFVLPIILTSCGKDNDKEVNNKGKDKGELPISHTVNLKNIIGEDDRNEVSFNTDKYKRVLKLMTKDSGCTASLIWDNLALTNNHCVNDVMNGDQIISPITVYISLNGNKFEDKSKVLEIRRGSLDGSDLPDDWGILKLEKPLGKIYGYYDLATTSPYLNFNDRNYELPGYSSDIKRGMVLTVDQNCTLRSYRERGTFYHDCNMTSGASGAPIIKDINGKKTIVGLNVAEFRDKEIPYNHVDRYSDNVANIGVRVENFVNNYQKWVKELSFKPQDDGPIDFDINQVEFKFSIYKVFLRRLRNGSFYLNIPESQKKYISKVTYNLRDSSFSQQVETDSDNNWKFSLNGLFQRTYTMEINIELVNGEILYKENTFTVY